jgi:hypothetical protein
MALRAATSVAAPHRAAPVLLVAPAAARRARAFSGNNCRRCLSCSASGSQQHARTTRRAVLSAAPALALLLHSRQARAESDFVTLPCGMLVQDIRSAPAPLPPPLRPRCTPKPAQGAGGLRRDCPTVPNDRTCRPGEGAAPQPGDTVVVHWAGFTKGYQGKRIDNTSVRDEPYEFVLGKGQVGGWQRRAAGLPGPCPLLRQAHRSPGSVRAGGPHAPSASIRPAAPPPFLAHVTPFPGQAHRPGGQRPSGQPKPDRPPLAAAPQAIRAFEEAVAGMQVGGIRRVEVPGERPELGYSRSRRERFTDEAVSSDLKVYRWGAAAPGESGGLGPRGGGTGRADLRALPPAAVSGVQLPHWSRHHELTAARWGD